MALTLHGTVSDNTVALDRKSSTPIIFNGDMRIAQRATSVSSVTGTAYYVCDRWKLGLSNTGTWTLSQDTDVPTGQGFSKSFKLDCTTADSSLASGDIMYLGQFLEGRNLQMLKKGTSDAEVITVAFWVKSSKTGTHILNVVSENTRSISKAYTVSSANTWEKKVITIDADTSGALNDDNNSSLQFFWWLAGGSNWSGGTLQTTWGTKVEANRAVGQVNLADSTDNNFLLTGVQVEIGTFDANSIPAFQFEDACTSLARCQRYFFTTFAQGTTPAQNVSANNYLLAVGTDAGSRSHGSLPFPVLMRSSPTITTFNPFASNASARQPNSSTDVAYESTTARDHSVGCSFTNTTTQSYHIHITADAEL